MKAFLVAAAVVVLPTHAAPTMTLANDYRTHETKPFSLRDFATAVFDCHDSDLGSAAASAPLGSTRLLKVNLTSSLVDNESLIGELSYLKASAFELERVWKVEFQQGSGGSIGRISEQDMLTTGSQNEQDSEFVGTGTGDARFLCNFNMRMLGNDAALSQVIDDPTGTVCTITAFALNDSKRAHMSIQITDTRNGELVRIIAMHRRETSIRKSNWESYGHYVLFALLFLVQVALRIWKNSKSGREWAQSGRAAAEARERAAEARELLKADGAPAASPAEKKDQ